MPFGRLHRPIRSPRPRRRRTLVLTAAVCALAAPALASPPPDFVAIRDVTPLVTEDIRYATARNFTGRPAPGYESGQCWLRRETAAALAKAAADFDARGYRLIVYDCYRPTRAVAAFVAWARNGQDQASKAEYYPGVDKANLLGRYIGARSAHSTGTAIDAGFGAKDGAALDFGTPFDFFGPASATAASDNTAVRANRQLLKSVMEKYGFRNYPGEWWHFSMDVPGARALDSPIK
jgi:zinc D-Ala-D-Ala dipeptidase